MTNHARALRPATAVLVLTLAACATNPATGKKEFSLMSEAQEIELGQEHGRRSAARDGRVQRSPSCSAMSRASACGSRAPRSGPNLPWHFAVVDEPAINAFALPGGYIYLTRGILPFLDNEAELAGVLGHEIGHVTARHSAQQYTKATSAGIGVTLLSIFVPEARPFQNLTETALGVLFLKYGRDDELQADRLGVDYTANTGWNPAGVGGHASNARAAGRGERQPQGRAELAVDASGARRSRASKCRRTSRRRRRGRLAPAGRADATKAEFLRRIDGIVFGDSPSQGIVRGNTFLHPDLRLSIDVSAAAGRFRTRRSQVMAKAPEQNDFMLLQLVPNASGSLEQVARGTMANAGFQQVNGERAQVNGLDAYVGTYQGQMQGLGNVVTLAAHIVHDRNVYLLRRPRAAERVPGGRASVRAEHPVVPRVERARKPPTSGRTASTSTPCVRATPGSRSRERMGEAAGIKPSTLAIMNNYEPASRRARAIASRSSSKAEPSDARARQRTIASMGMRKIVRTLARVARCLPPWHSATRSTFI